MSRQEQNSFDIRLRNAEGVPVLQVGGHITKAALKAVRLTLDRLAGAGHYHVVLNIEKAQAANWRFLAGLAGAVRNIRQHYGVVDLVAGRERLSELLRAGKVAELFRLNPSEGQAISRIKKLPRPPDAISDTGARLK